MTCWGAETDKPHRVNQPNNRIFHTLLPQDATISPHLARQVIIHAPWQAAAVA